MSHSNGKDHVSVQAVQESGKQYAAFYIVAFRPNVEKRHQKQIKIVQA